jgi:hypothetical protein
MRITLNKYNLTLLSFLSILFCYAAPAPDLPVPQGGPPVPPGEIVPIDNGIIILVVLAIIYAAYIFKLKIQPK